MQILSDQDGIQYEVLDNNSLEEAVLCVSEVFAAEEPLVKHLQITFAEMHLLCQAMYPALATQGLSVIAREQQSREVIGVRSAGDFAVAGPEEIAGLSPKFFPIFALLEELDNYYKKDREIIPGKYVHMFMMAVKQGYKERNIAPNMNREFLQLIREKGYDYAIAEATGNISQHILLKKLGFRELFAISYREFTFNGKRVFSEITEHSKAALVEKEL